MTTIASETPRSKENSHLSFVLRNADHSQRFGNKENQHRVMLLDMSNTPTTKNPKSHTGTPAPLRNNQASSISSISQYNSINSNPQAELPPKEHAYGKTQKFYFPHTLIKKDALGAFGATTSHHLHRNRSNETSGYDLKDQTNQNNDNLNVSKM